MVKKFNSIDERFWSKVSKVPGDDGCWEWQASLHHSGYGQFFMKGRGRPIMAHRISWELTHGDIPTGILVLHKCDNRKCVRPEHLFLGTDKDNCDDMWKKNRQQDYSIQERGSARWAAKLTESDIPVIRKRRQTGEKLSDIGHDYGVTKAVIWEIVSGRAWKHVP